MKGVCYSIRIFFLFFLAKTAQSFATLPQWLSHRPPTQIRSTPSSLNSFFLPQGHELESVHIFQQSLPHVWEAYGSLLKEHPVTTKSVTAAILACTGDAVAQFRSKQEQENFQYDARRGLAYVAFGALYTGCFQHFWFTLLNQNVADWGEALHIWGHPAETTIPVSHFIQRDGWWQYFDLVSEIQNVMATLQDPPSQTVLAAAKVALNQLCVIPLVYMPLFFAITGALGGLDFNMAMARARSLYLPLLRRNYLFWLPVQFFQFLVLPAEWQIPFVCAASLCWTVILSSISVMPTSSIVGYETSNNSDEQEAAVTVLAVDAGAVNEVTDAVRAKDVQEALVPRAVSSAVESFGDAIGDALSDSKVGASAGGLTLGLLASAADDAAIGAAVGGVLGVQAQVGVSLMTAAGAGVGYLAAKAREEKDLDEIVTEDGDIASTYQVANATANSFQMRNSTGLEREAGYEAFTNIQ